MRQSERERVIVWGGRVFTEEELKHQKITDKSELSAVEIGEGLFMQAPEDGPNDLEDYMNHSCDPNVWLEDEVTLVARRDIKPGDELTIDYSTFVTNSLNKYYGGGLLLKCNCRSNVCRQLITDSGWMLKDLQERCRGHFSPHINKRIEMLNAKLRN